MSFSISQTSSAESFSDFSFDYNEDFEETASKASKKARPMSSKTEHPQKSDFKAQKPDFNESKIKCKLVALKLNNYMQKYNLNQQKLSKQTGVAYALFCRYCHGHYLPNKNTVEKIDKVTGIGLKETLSAKSYNVITGENLKLFLELYQINLQDFAQLIDMERRHLFNFCEGRLSLDTGWQQKIWHYLNLLEENSEQSWKTNPLKLRIGKKIENYLRVHKITLKRFSKETGIHPSTIKKYRNSRHQPPSGFLKKLEQELQSTPSQKDINKRLRLSLRRKVENCVNTNKISPEIFAAVANITMEQLTTYLENSARIDQRIYRKIRLALKIIRQPSPSTTPNLPKQVLQKTQANFLREEAKYLLTIMNFSWTSFAELAEISESTLERFLATDDLITPKCAQGIERALKTIAEPSFIQMKPANLNDEMEESRFEQEPLQNTFQYIPQTSCSFFKNLSSEETEAPPLFTPWQNL